MDTGRPQWLPDDADAERPSIARMYDYFLGGSRHLEIDRDIARQAMAAAPGIKLLILQNRKFLKRVARFTADLGIDQYLDLGSGIPAFGNLHSAVQADNPRARVVYVDIDPVAVARGAELLKDNGYAISVSGDITRPQDILGDSEVRRLLDVRRPVAVLMLNVLHFLPFPEVAPAVAAFREAMASGSVLAISHGTADLPGTDPSGITEVYANAFGHMAMRRHDEVADLFGDFRLVEPGIVDLPLWRSDGVGLSARLGPVNCYAAVGVKP